jgi:hypothetical protein
MKKLFLASTFLLTIIATNISGMGQADPKTTKDDEPEETKPKEKQVKTNPEIDESNNPDLKKETIQEFLTTVHESLKINISCKTELIDNVLYVQVLVIQALDKFKEADKRSSTDQKMAPKQQMTYNTLLYLVRNILIKYGLKVTLSENTYLIEKTESKSLDKN